MPARPDQPAEPSLDSNSNLSLNPNSDLRSEQPAAAPDLAGRPPTEAGAAPLAFGAVLEHDGETGGVYVLVPPAVAAALGAGSRANRAVRATFDGFPHNGILTPLPGAEPEELLLLVPKQVRKAIGKTWTNDVAVTLAPDPDAVALELPADLRAALAAVRGSRARFGQLSKAHQREYVAWIASARTEEGRAERLAQTAERMMIGVKKK